MSKTAVAVLDATEPAILAAGIGWKVTSWSRALRQALQHLPADLRGKTLVELGGGQYGLNLFLSRLGCRTLCLDRRLDFSKESRALHHGHGVRCEHVLSDARAIALPSGSVDVVVMKSVLGGIYSEFGREGALECLSSVRRVLRAGGILIALEQLRGDPLSRWLRRLRYPSRRWHYFEVAELTPGAHGSLLADFERLECRTLTLLGHSVEDWLAHGNPLVRAASFVDHAIEPLVPANWKHLVAVVAKATG